MRLIAILAAGALLAACQTTVAVKNTCLPQKAYTQQELDAAAAALEALPANSPLVGLVADFKAMRDANRACIGHHL